MAYKKPNIINSQFVHIEQTPASIGNRILATIIDWIVLVFVFSSLRGLIASINPNPIVGAILLVIPSFYTPVCEQIFNGLTLGKLALGSRVVMQNGESVSISASFLRWMLSFVDIYLFFIGPIAMLCNKRNMRIGDLAAGTIVIKERTSYKEINQLSRFTYLSNNYTPKLPFVADMTWGQVKFINETIVENKLYNLSQREQENINMLAGMIATKYNLVVNPRDYHTFLRQIVNDYNYYTWHDNV